MADQLQPDEPRSDQLQSDSVRSEEPGSDETSSDDLRPDESTSERSQSAGAPSDELRSDPIRPDHRPEDDQTGRPASDQSSTRRRLVLPAGLIIAALVVGALAGAVSTVVRGATYTSESQLSWDPSVRAELDPDFQTPDGTAFDRQVADQREVVLSDQVVGAAAKRLDLSAVALRDAVDVVTTPGSSVFTIDADASSAAESRRIANATTAAYTAALKARNAATLKARIAALAPVIAELRKQLGTANGAAAGPLANSIGNLQSQSAGYSVTAQQVPVEATVLRAAVTPDRPSSLTPFVSAIIGAVLGLVLGVCIALLVRRVPSPQRSTTPAPRARETRVRDTKTRSNTGRAPLPVRISPPSSRSDPGRAMIVAPPHAD